MAKLFNRAKMDTSTTGSGTITLGSAVSGYQSFADAGVSNGDVVQYVIEDGANWEIGTGTYSATGTSLTRSPTESSSGGAAISLTGTASVFITAVADDLNRLQSAGSTKIEATASGVDVTGNITVGGTVDGRDVAADGTKLDGIEAGADVTDTANVTSAGALMTTGGTMTGSLEAYGSPTDTIISVKTNTSGQSTFDGSGAGVQLIAGGMNTTSKYTPSLQFGSYDSDLSPVPKMLASVVGRARETYAASTDGGMALDFFTTSNDSGSGQQAVHAMTIDHNGRVGIGTESPSQALDVIGDAEINGAITVQNDITVSRGTAAPSITMSNSNYGGGDASLAYFDTGSLLFRTNGSEQMRIDADGKVGIGTTAPQAELDVRGYVDITTGTGTATFGSLNTSWFHMTTDRPSFYMNKGLKAAGDVGVYGQNTYLTGADMYLDGVIRHYGDTNTYMQFNAADQWRVVVGNVERMKVTTTGVGIKSITPSVALDVNGSIEYTGTITDVSDDRLKENKVQITGALDAIKSLTGYTYNMVYEGDNQTEMGLIAQDVQAVLPVAVKNIKIDTDGDGTDEDYLGVSYIQLIAPMIEAMKEQQQQIEALQARIDVLEATT